MSNYGEGTISSNSSLIGSLSSRGNLSGGLVARDNNMSGSVSAPQDINGANINVHPSIDGGTVVTDNEISGILTTPRAQINGAPVISYNPTYALKVEAGAEITLSLDETDYTLYAILKDIDGNVISTSNIIDLPLESIIVDGYYDADTKEIVLTLENGSVIRFSVADMVGGLQPEITSDNKLASDLVDDTNQTHKFITAADKTYWDNKQNPLISGVNIKSINGNSIVGSGNLDLNLDKNYVHNQSSAASTWTINHNLNKYPAVMIMDNSGNEIQGEIVYNNLNTITIKFNSSITGKATLN